MRKISANGPGRDDLNSRMENLSTKERNVPKTPIKSSMKNMHITAENFEQLMDPCRIKLIDSDNLSIGSPLSLKSCAMCGIDPLELYPVPYETFLKMDYAAPFHNSLGDRLSVKLKGGEQRMLATRRFEEFEKHRQLKIEKVKRQRNRLITEESNRKSTFEKHDRRRLNPSIVRNDSIRKTEGSSAPQYSARFREKSFQMEFLKRKAAAEDRRRQTLQRALEIRKADEMAVLKEQIASEYRRNENLREQSLHREQKLQNQANKRAIWRESVEHNIREQLYRQKSIQRECDKSHVIYHSPMFGRILKEADRLHTKQKTLSKIKVHDAKLAYLTPQMRTKN